MLAVKCGTTIFILNLFFSKLFGRSCTILQYWSDTTGPGENLALYPIKRHNCSKLWKKINGRKKKHEWRMRRNNFNGTMASFDRTFVYENVSYFLVNQPCERCDDIMSGKTFLSHWHYFLTRNILSRILTKTQLK